MRSRIFACEIKTFALQQTDMGVSLFVKSVVARRRTVSCALWKSINFRFQQNLLCLTMTNGFTNWKKEQVHYIHRAFIWHNASLALPYILRIKPSFSESIVILWQNEWLRCKTTTRNEQSEHKKKQKLSVNLYVQKLKRSVDIAELGFSPSLFLSFF